jgi:hypothetical protein
MIDEITYKNFGLKNAREKTPQQTQAFVVLIPQCWRTFSSYSFLGMNDI